MFAITLDKAVTRSSVILIVQRTWLNHSLIVFLTDNKNGVTTATTTTTLAFSWRLFRCWCYNKGVAHQIIIIGNLSGDNGLLFCIHHLETSDAVHNHKVLNGSVFNFYNYFLEKASSILFVKKWVYLLQNTYPIMLNCLYRVF